MLDLRCCYAPMGSEHDRTIFLGLAALYQVAEQSRGAPVQPSLLLRATLAALYGHSDGNRAPYEAFWRTCQDNASFAFSEAQGASSRCTATTIAWNGIVLGLGIRPGMDFMDAIYRAAHGASAPPRNPPGSTRQAGSTPSVR